MVYIFDFDGTLAESMPTFGAGMLALLKENNVSYPDDIIKTITPLGWIGAAKYFIEKFSLPYDTESLVAIMHERLYPNYRDEIILKDCVAEYLKTLKENGHMVCLLTASPYKMVSAVLKRCGVYKYFDYVWSCEDFNMTKGEPEIYRAAVERAGSSIQDAVFFDDNVGAIKAAKKAGLFTVGVYDDSSRDYIEEVKNTADAFIYRFDEMGQID